MTDINEQRSFMRMITPLILIVSGLSLIKLQPDLLNVSDTLLLTLGFSIYTIGSFSFIIILNHARNPFVTEKIIYNTSQALIVYGGILIAVYRTNILTLETSITSVGIILIIGTTIGVVLDYIGSE